MRLIGYIRVSTATQVRDGFSLKDQYDLLMSKGAYEIYRDEGVSGTLEDRPGLLEAFAALTKGDTLLVARLDRLARDLIVQEQLVADLDKRGIKIESLAEPDLCTNDPTRVLLRQIIGAISQYERSVICRRLRIGRVHKHKEGGYAGGAPPFGYDAVEGELVINGAEAHWVREVYTSSDMGASLSSIARSLNEQGVKTKRGGKWHPSTVKAILTNSIYRGGIQYGGKESAGTHEPILEGCNET